MNTYPQIMSFVGNLRDVSDKQLAFLHTIEHNFQSATLPLPLGQCAQGGAHLDAF